MVCTANDLQGWKDFPKGLRVLVLDGDTSSAFNIKSKLEAMDYIVSTFCNETEALFEFSSKPGSYHVAIVEVNTRNGEQSFKFLESAKDLPIIMTSDIHCLSTIMKCISLGAVEFLHKPISEDKLRNIWQHVVHKAFNNGGIVLSEPVKHVKESVSTIPLELENGAYSTISNENKDQENDREHSAGCDKYPAPSTPQLNHGARLFDDKDCQDQTNYSMEKEGREGIGECKFVETTCTCGNSVAESTPLVEKHQMARVSAVKEEEDSADGSRIESNTSSNPHNGDTLNDAGGGTAENPSKMSALNSSCRSKSNRKKLKVDWTSELHKKFVQAVEQLGVDQAIPSRILELMKVEGLTRHNIASHLQKYRMHKRSILPKEEDRRWQHPRDAMHRNYYHTKPIMAYPPYHSNHALPIAPAYPMWRQPVNHPATNQIWSPPAYSPWQPSENWQWKPYNGMHADAWGCPVVPPPHGLYNNSYVQNASRLHNAGVVVNNGGNMMLNSFDFHPADELLDKVVKEAISKPWLPLPLGLKPPSTDSVLSELSRQGISTVPHHHINGSHSI